MIIFEPTFAAPEPTYRGCNLVASAEEFATLILRVQVANDSQSIASGSESGNPCACCQATAAALHDPAFCALPDTQGAGGCVPARPAKATGFAAAAFIRATVTDFGYGLRMTLRELRYLVALADHGHFGRAADACNISQPTLSMQLKKLEDRLGVVVFERTSKALQVTPIGRRIIDQARRVLAEADALVDLAHATAAPLTGPLALGVIPTLGPYLLPWLMPLLRRDFPALQLILVEDLTDNLIDQLRAHQLDAAILALPAPVADLQEQVLFDEPFFFACSPGHPLAAARSLADAELQRQRLLLLTDGHCLREQALAVCGQSEASIREYGADFRATSLETLRQMVATGMGATLLPALAAARAREQGITVIPLERGASRRIGLFWRRSYPKGCDLERLAVLLRGSLPAEVHPA